MPPLLKYSGQNELHHERSFYPNSMSHMEECLPPSKRARISAPWVLWGHEFEQEKSSVFDVLPDECLVEIFKHLPAQERSVCACVSKHWLTLLGSIRRAEICDDDRDDDKEIDSCLTKSLEGKKATDVRLAAIAVGTAGRGGLEKLSIRGLGSTHGVTNFGLYAIARGSPSLKSISLWNLSSIGDEGVSEIAIRCPLLERLDLCQCPSITNKGLIAIAKHCPNLATLSIDSCPNIGNDSIQAISQGCLKLESISIKDCPLVGDQGIASLLSSSSSVLSKLRIQNLNISDFSLAVIGHYGKSITNLNLSSLPNVSEKGFWAMGNARGLKTLASLSVGSCLGVTDLSLEAIGKGCSSLKHISLRKCSLGTDSGLLAFSKSAGLLESVRLEECIKITLKGILCLLRSCSSNLRSLSLVKCMGIKDIIPFQATLDTTCVSLKSLSIKNCPSFGNAGLAMLGKMCPNLRQVDLRGLYGITDDSVLSILESCPGGLVKLNLSGCINLSDESILAMVRLHGETIKVLNLDGCRRITDTSLLAIAKSCPLLKDLDISNCPITDSGITALSCSEELNLEILSISGCSRISNKSVPCLMELGKNLVGLNLQHCNLLSSKNVSMLVGDLWSCDILC